MHAKDSNIFVNNAQLATILDCSTSLIYSGIIIPKDEGTNENLIDLNSFVIKHDNKNSCAFHKKRFSNRLFVDYKECDYIFAKDVREILDISYYELKKLRDTKKITYVYKTSTLCLYEVNSLKKLHPSKSKKIFKVKKEFFTVLEVLEILDKTKHNISRKTLYRYIQKGLIPNIHFGTNYRIPILEFNNFLNNLNKEEANN